MLLLLLWNSFVWCQPKDVDALAANVIVSLVDSNGSLLLALWLEMSVGQPGWMEPVVNCYINYLITLLLCSIHQIPSVPIVDCYQKIRQQVKCYLQMAGVMGKNELQEVSWKSYAYSFCLFTELCIIITVLCILLTVVVLISLSPILRGSSFSGRAYVFALMQYLVQWGRERLTRTGGCMLATFHQFCSLL